MNNADDGTAVEFANYVEVLRHRARCNPDLQIYTFLEHGDGAERTITCAELDERAHRTAAALSERVSPGERVLLLYPPGIDYIVGLFSCMYAGVIAVPAYPIEPAQVERTLPRLLGIINDCHARAILTTAAAREQAMRFLSGSRSIAQLPWIATDELGDSVTSRPVSAPTPDNTLPVYLQYTSGSTGAPKGVMVSHQNLLHNSVLIKSRFEHSAASRGVIWLPPYHDMGLIGGILQPLYAGFPVVLMSHIDFLKHPLRWLRTISRFRATTSGGPNFAYEMLASMRITDADFEKLDLSSWDVAFTGAEPVRAKTLRAFAQRFAPCGFRSEAFYPCYGLAEHTLFVTGGEKSRAPVLATIGSGADYTAADGNGEAMRDETKTVVGCGHTADSSRLLVVDPQTCEPCADGQVGELWAQGPSVAMGYWGKRRLSQQTFRARLKGSTGSFLRTGDYGYRIGAEFFITGRLKDMMVIRGANHYPQDIEATIEEIDTDIFRPGGCAVFALEASVAPRVVVVREVRARYIKLIAQQGDEGALMSSPSADEIFGRLRRAVSQRHGIAVSDIVLAPPATVPKTTSGKTQRHLCRSLFVEGSLLTVTRWSADELAVGGRAVKNESVEIGECSPV
ncbi:MAG: fatty acyl-AMP ligase [Burkholderiales bacterium RIFCSPLOWO2_02_FULL_57_36]|nr:MAG: fatty acyl-AMP ligase [Burkholderiales bacterium RIFCSPLOWO2_02_FULL_57_36]